MIRRKRVVENDVVVEDRLVRTNYKVTRSPGRKVVHGFPPQELTDERFMSAAQKRAFRAGEKIYV